MVLTNAGDTVKRAISLRWDAEAFALGTALPENGIHLHEQTIYAPEQYLNKCFVLG